MPSILKTKTVFLKLNPILNGEIQMQKKSFFIRKSIQNVFAIVSIIALLAGPSLTSVAKAETTKEIDVSVDVALDRFKNEIPGANEFLANAKGVLVIPNVIRVGFVLGAEYGEGALIIDGKTVDYYSLAAGSLGFQIGAQSKNIVIIFMDENALTKFRDSLGWRAGIDGSIALVDQGAGASVDTSNLQHPIVGFIFGVKGLMVNLSLEGSKFTKLIK
jgi:lipid-binding SYLF domain-containing protein